MFSLELRGLILTHTDNQSNTQMEHRINHTIYLITLLLFEHTNILIHYIINFLKGVFRFLHLSPQHLVLYFVHKESYYYLIDLKIFNWRGGY